MRATTKLRSLLTSGKITVAPGAYDGLSARMVEQAGFPAVYASGGAIARSTGVPDLGLISMNSIVDRLASMVDVVGVPIVADADTGYGNALNTQGAARAFERAGVAAFHLEDQTFPKKCGHYDDKSIVPKAEMVQKLKAARDALHDPDFVLIASTDADRGRRISPPPSTARPPISRLARIWSSSKRRLRKPKSPRSQNACRAGS